MFSEDAQPLTIRNRAAAIFVAAFAALAFAGDATSVLYPAPVQFHWILPLDWLLPHPAVILANIFFYAYLWWLVLFFFRRTREKERIIVVCWSIDMVEGQLNPFVPRVVAVLLQYLTTAAMTVALFIALLILLRILRDRGEHSAATPSE